jgi:hypothetical protein
VKPDRAPLVVDDLGPLLRGGRDVRLRRDEHVAGRVLVAPLQHRDRRRLERRRIDERYARVVVVARRRRRRRPRRDGGGENGGEERGEAVAVHAVHQTPRTFVARSEPLSTELVNNNDIRRGDVNY